MGKTMYYGLVSFLLAMGLLLGGCSRLEDRFSSTNSQEFSDLPHLNGKATVVMMVNDNPITIELRGNAAPITAGNFVDLVRRGVYKNVAFHRVVKKPEPFVVQGGDPQSREPKVPISKLGTGHFVDPETSQPRYIPLEILPQGADSPVYSQTLSQAGITAPPVLRHQRGAVSMARSQMPDTASAQFFFALADLEFLDGNYAVFGYVTEGMQVVDNIQKGDRIQAVQVVEGLENLQRS
jgi:peptidyl-prolyl cis-trans isomerase B (cyclophilin B)